MDEVKIKNFGTEMEAEMVKRMLLEYGIKCRVQTYGVDSSGIPSDRYGADLIVLSKDQKIATDLLQNI